MKFEINESKIPGCLEIIPHVFRDERGLFVKTFHEEAFRNLSLSSHFAEEYYSISHKGVLRGLHFQTPPKDHEKMVYCLQGKVMDVLVDLRVDSPTYGQHCQYDLSAEKRNILYIPKGIAHGFLVISESALLVYKVTSTYSPEHDNGIHWNSLGIKWPFDTPQVSVRDNSFVGIQDFHSPFRYTEGRWQE